MTVKAFLKDRKNLRGRVYVTGEIDGGIKDVTGDGLENKLKIKVIKGDKKIFPELPIYSKEKEIIELSHTLKSFDGNQIYLSMDAETMKIYELKIEGDEDMYSFDYLQLVG